MPSANHLTNIRAKKRLWQPTYSRLQAKQVSIQRALQIKPWLSTVNPSFTPDRVELSIKTRRLAIAAALLSHLDHLVDTCRWVQAVVARGGEIDPIQALVDRIPHWNFSKLILNFQ